ncbi:MAG: C25 family cysteine peptidase, partial [Planctomycetota bacterium]
MRLESTLALAIALSLLGRANAEDTAPSKKRPSTVLLVTAESLEEAWAPFVRWKTRLGKAATVVTVEEISKKYEGADIQEKIRACCLDHIEKHGTRWVVLGGDSEPGGKGLVPDRDTPHKCMSVNYSDIATDAYYISDKDWDADDDGVYGDFVKDRPEIAYSNEKACIGRIPVRTAEDVDAYTAKVVAYESKYPGGTFATTLVQTCPERGAYPKLSTSKGVLEKAWSPGKVLLFF